MACVIPLILYRRSMLKTATITAVLASFLTSWSIVPLTLAGLCVAIETYRLSTARLPVQWHPLPVPPWWRNPLLAIRCHRCDRRIGRGDLVGARNALRGAGGPWAVFRVAFLDLEEHEYQSALSLVPEKADLPPRLRAPSALLRARGLSGTAQFVAARDLYRHTLLTSESLDAHLADYMMVLIAENDFAAGQIEDAARVAKSVADQPRKDSDYFLRQRALRLLAEHALDEGDIEQARKLIDGAMEDLLASRSFARLALHAHDDKMVRAMFGRSGSVYLPVERIDVIGRRVDPRDDSDWEYQFEALSLAMALSRSTDDLVELFLFEARSALADNKSADALALVARALMELDRARYLLAAQSSRSSWSKRFRRVLEFALTAAHVAGDHEFGAELLEFARVQTLPSVTAELAGDLVLSTPPVVLVNGRTRLARPGEPHRPQHVRLEVAARRAAGEGAWWLSYWSAGDWLYRAVVSPDGTVATDRIEFDPDSLLRAALRELEKALPVVMADEHPIAADFRIADSPLLVDPIRELALSAELGRLLLPDELVRAAARRRADGTRLPLAIAPVAELGYLPWSLLVASKPESDDPDRLVDVCDWVLAPSAALICNAPAAEPGPAPLALVVADTTDAPPLGELESARNHVKQLPNSVRVIGGTHWTHEVATIERLETELGRIGADVTVNVPVPCRSRRSERAVQGRPRDGTVHHG